MLCVFNFLHVVWVCDETRSLVFDISLLGLGFCKVQLLSENTLETLEVCVPCHKNLNDVCSLFTVTAAEARMVMCEFMCLILHTSKWNLNISGNKLCQLPLVHRCSNEFNFYIDLYISY